MKAWILLIVSPAALAQTAYTNCYPVGNSVQCTTIQQPGIAPPAQNSIPQIVQPDFVGNVLRGQQASQQIRQIQLQNQLLDEQLRAQRNQKIEAERAAAAAAYRESSDAPREDRERMIRLHKSFQQSEACIRTNMTNDVLDQAGFQACIDRLMLNDPEYARAIAEARSDNSPEIREAVSQWLQDKQSRPAD